MDLSFNHQKWLVGLLAILWAVYIPLRASNLDYYKYYVGVDKAHLEIQKLIKNGVALRNAGQFQESYKLLQEASDQGSFVGTSLLGILYMQDKKFKDDDSKTLSYLDKAIQLNRKQGGDNKGDLILLDRVYVAVLYFCGDKIHKDYARAYQMAWSVVLDLSGQDGRDGLIHLGTIDPTNYSDIRREILELAFSVLKACQVKPFPHRTPIPRNKVIEVRL
ncbi:hypothetical protein NHP190003_16260 (plasmid) [Helicobacter sp. NHP19-003]|uniref:Beta-lactamase n=1 Tax=Helicobacter gastrocanis TaxID=2849641 RepID=A0ABN6I6U3_9HELI|nr:hypothetical protein [Helicobacter sp. NHP19-003]BCZ18344.1 hypothetical protein NHP190003_16260 [Helicobacter sp. NHP19-003]